MSKVVLSGYYGFNNAGDETILYAIIRTLKAMEPEIEITVLSHKPAQTAKQYNVQAVNRWRIFSILKTLVSCDLLISGGGSLLQDVTSANNPLYYLGIIFMAKLMGKRTFVYAQGVGPLRRRHNRKLTAWLLNRVNCITVRDLGSQEELASMGVNRQILVTADPVLGLLSEDIDTDKGQEILRRNGIEPENDQKLLGVFIRSWQENSFLEELAKACDSLVDEGWQVVFIPMHFPDDIGICKKAVKQMNREAFVLKEMYTPEEILSITKNLKQVIGMRLHALINGVVAGVPVVGLSYDPKIDRFLNQIVHPSMITVQDLCAHTLLEVVNRVDTKRQEIQKEIEQQLLVLYDKAWQTARLALDQLK